LDRNLSYQIEIDICDIAQKISSTSVKFVGLLWRHEKPWINRWVREVNLWLERSLVKVGRTHIDVVDISSNRGGSILSMVCILILEARTSSCDSLQRALKADTFQLSWVFRILFWVKQCKTSLPSKRNYKRN
jgi:hypothetical protein